MRFFKLSFTQAYHLKPNRNCCDSPFLNMLFCIQFIEQQHCFSLRDRFDRGEVNIREYWDEITRNEKTVIRHIFVLIKKLDTLSWETVFLVCKPKWAL